MSNLDAIATFGARLSQIHAPLHAAYIEYARPNGSDVDFVNEKLMEAVDKLRELTKQIEKWNG